MRTLTWLVMGLMVGQSPLARAQPASTQAEQLFREGKRLVGEGRISEACAAFEGSLRKDLVVTTLLNLADCRERNQQFASAWGHFLDAERMTRDRPEHGATNATAKTRAAALEPRLSYLIINVATDASIDGLQITLNAAAVDSAVWNTDMPVDGGDYVIEGRAPGFEPWATKVTVEPSGDKESVNVPRFRARPEVPTPQVPDAVATAVVPPAIDTQPRFADVGHDRGPATRSSLSTVGKVGIATGGATVLAGLAVGFLAHQKWAEAKSLCGVDLACDNEADFAAGQALVEDTRSRARISTIITGAGLAVVGIGAVLLISAPAKRAPSRPRVGLRAAPVLSANTAALVLVGEL